MFTTKSTFAIVYSAVRSRAARCSALLVLSGLLTYAQHIVGYYEGSTTFPLTNLVNNGSLQKLTHLNYAFAAVNPTSSGGYTCAVANPDMETARGILCAIESP